MDASVTIVELTPSIPTLTYDGTDQRGKITATAKDGSGAAVNGLTFTYDFSANPINAGEYTVTISVDTTANPTYAGTVTTGFTIGKKALTLTANSFSLTAGSAEPTYTYTAGALASGDSITTPPTLSCSPTMSTVGSYPITIDVSGVVIKNGSGTDVTANYTITGANGTLTVRSGGGGGGGGGGSSSSTPSTSIVSTGDKTEGGTTTTTTTATPSATTKGDTATATVSTSVGNQIVEQAKENGSTEVVIAPTVTGDVSKTQVSIPSSTVGNIGSQTVASLTVSTPVAAVSIPNGGLSDLASEGGTVTVTAEKVGNQVTLEVTAGGEAVSEVTGGITLTVPHDDCDPGTVAMLVHEDGSREVVRKSVADNGTLTVTIPLTGSATLELVDNATVFEDVAGNAWYSDAVDFVSARGLFGGVSETAAIFDGDSSMTRGMLAVVLHRLENNPDHAFTGNFDDVLEGSWYGEAIHWMAEAGIAGGYGNGNFGAEDNITREQLAVMLWRYAGSPAATKKELDFTDADEAGSWAVDALIWAQENGIMQGNNNAVNPKGNASRAHVAQMLKNFIENVLK